MITAPHPTSQQRRLLAGAAAALAAVALTVRFDVSTPDQAVAVAVLAAAAAATLGTAQRRRQRHFGWLPVALLAAAATAVAAPVAAAHTIRADRRDTPQATVHDFLSAAVVDRNGNAAAAYLSPRARISYEGHSPTNPDDEQFFAGAHLTLGGLDVESNAQLGQLTYTLLRGGRDPVVWVSHGDQGMLFSLAPASPTDRNEFRGPQTPWRIESSVAALSTTPAAPATGAHAAPIE